MARGRFGHGDGGLALENGREKMELTKFEEGDEPPPACGNWDLSNSSGAEAQGLGRFQVRSNGLPVWSVVSSTLRTSP